MGLWNALGRLVGLDEEQVVRDFEKSVAAEANGAFAADPKTEVEVLWLIAKEDDSVWPQILANPNCSPELSEWIAQARVDPVKAGYVGEPEGRSTSVRITPHD